MKTMEMKRSRRISRRLLRFARANEAVSALEYAILVGVIIVGVGAALVAFETDVSTAITDLGNRVNTGVDTTGTPALPNN